MYRIRRIHSVEYAMPRVAAIATASPDHTVSQEKVIEFAKSVYGKSKLFTRILPVFKNALVKNRHFAVDLEWLRSKHSFTETNDLYISTSLDLIKKATLKLAEQCAVPTTDFDIVFLVSTTGLSTPSLDARLFNMIPLNPHIKRVPIWGLGCAGGVSALVRAYDYLKAYPTHRALILSVELCSLSFQLNDITKANMISAALFGDGAAACAVLGDDVPEAKKLAHAQPSILGSLSTIYPDSLNVMSWRVTSEGFKVQLSRDIPTIVTSLVKGNIEEFLNAHELSLNDMKNLIFHPGGTKVLQAYEAALNVPTEKLIHSYEVLRDFGNMSSVTVYFVLKRFLEDQQKKSEEYGLIGALGPGFSSDLVLIRWN